MTSDRRAASAREAIWDRYRRRFLAALVLLVWADLVATRGAAGVYGLEAEFNPVMRWLLGLDGGVVLGVHILVFVLSVLAFRHIARIGRSLSGTAARQFDRLCIVWIHGLMLVGVLVVINNFTLTIVGVLL